MADRRDDRTADGRSVLQAELESMLGSALEARWLAQEVGDPEEARWLAARRRDGAPLQYLLGHWSFRRLDLLVDARVLIPRPETEQVVEVALEMLEDAVADARRSSGPTVVDLGTGSGAIALSIATEASPRHPGIQVWATDVSPDALDVARSNRCRVAGSHGGAVPGSPTTVPAASRVVLRCGSWWDAVDPGLQGRVDLVVANPPYVSATEWVGLQPEIREHEPRVALVAPDGPTGAPGTADIAAVLSEAPRWLAPGGGVVVEIAPHQAAAADALARHAGLRDVRIRRDLSGRQRMVTGRRGP